MFAFFYALYDADDNLIPRHEFNAPTASQVSTLIRRQNIRTVKDTFLGVIDTTVEMVYRKSDLFVVHLTGRSGEIDKGDLGTGVGSAYIATQSRECNNLCLLVFTRCKYVSWLHGMRLCNSSFCYFQWVMMFPWRRL